MKLVEPILQRTGLDQVSPVIRKVVIGVIGTTILLLGLLLIFLPGPGLLFIFIGLGVLASEFVWARRIVRQGRVMVGRAGRTFRTAVKE